jgi:hypothetical protein
MKQVIVACAFYLLAVGLIAQDSLTVIGTLHLPSSGEYVGPIWFLYSQATYPRGADIDNDGFDDYILPMHKQGMAGVGLGVFMGQRHPQSEPDLVLPWDDDVITGVVPTWQGDLNNDGWNDLLAMYQSWESMYGVISLEDSVFDSISDLTFGYPDYWDGFLALNGGFDFNNDGFDDILCLDYSWDDWSGNVDVLFGYDFIGNMVDLHMGGSMAAHPGLRALYMVGDVNGDGTQDLILSQQEPYDDSPLYLTIRCGSPDFGVVETGSFMLPYPEMREAFAIANGDFNGDGCDDIAFVYSDTLFVYQGSGDLGFYLVTIPIPHQQPQVYSCSAFYCNINNDSYDDIVVKMTRDSTISVFCGGPQPPSQPGYTMPVAGNEVDWGVGCDLGDFTGDGYNDILISAGGDAEHCVTATIYSLHASSEEDHAIPRVNRLLVRPNPFRDRARIAVCGEMPLGSEARVEVFNLRGQRVRELPVDSSGSTQWDGYDAAGRPVATGVYFCRVVATGHAVSTGKMLLIR